MSPHALTLSKTAEHYTPSWLVEAARRVMGSIDTDPCSCEEAQKTVKAGTYFTKEQDGLKQEWHGNVFVNPPGGRGVPQAFWRKLMQERSLGNARRFVWLAFNISHLRTLQQVWVPGLEGCLLCVPERRIPFSGNNPTKDNAVLFGGATTVNEHVAFYDAFSAYGAIWGPRHAPW